jgi:hypothetical protein
MKKDECESKIRYLCHEWANGRSEQQRERLASFLEFRAWLMANGYSQCLDFKSRAGALFDAELWFDQELGQTWTR